MNLVFFVISCVLASSMAIGAVLLTKISNKIRPSIQALCAGAAVTIIVNASAVIAATQIVSEIFYGLYFAFTDWLAVLLLIFTRNYTNTFTDKLSAKIIVYGFCAADTIQMVANPYTHHAFSVDQTVIFGDEISNVLVGKTPYYTAHLIGVYLILLMVAASMIAKVVQTVKLYRKKYEVVVICIALVLVTNITYRFTGIPIDISPILYGLLAIALAYFSMFYVPQGLVVRLLSFSVEQIDSSIVCFDKDNQCVFENNTTRKITCTEQRFEDLREFLYIMDIEDEIDVLQEYTWQLERSNFGEKLYIEMRYKPLFDSKNNYIGCYMVMYDRTKDALSIEKERYSATHDELTGIYNRKMFFECVRRKLDKDLTSTRYIVALDVKEFKLINEIYGEKFGDEMLVYIATVLRRNLHKGSIYGRFSGDRFVACIDSSVTERDCIEIAEIIERKMKNSVYKMHVHLGVYSITDPAMKVSVMCDRAFMAIQKIKENYKQTIAYYDNELDEQLHRQNAMITEFDNAIKTGQFRMFLQPQISSDGLKLLGAEALMRWMHPEKGMVSPGEFIDVFEKTGHIYQLDSYIWRCACKKLREWKEIGREDLHISVNISPKDLYYCDIYETFTSLVKEYEIDPSRLKLEITETSVMSNLQKNLAIFEKLQNYGFQIEMDDFGSGYSSLNTLKDVKIDILKLDMGFLRAADTNQKSRVILDSVILMAKNLGLRTVVEGVETEEQVEYLTNAGCDVFQGYFFSKPISVPEFESKYGISKVD